MPYEIFLAFRYLRSRHKRKLARVTALAAVTGVAMGVAALIIAMALSNGFRDEMRDKILQGTSHLNVLRSDGQPIPDHESVAARIRNIAGVVSASATTYDGAVVNGPKGSAYAVLRGVEDGAGEMSSLKLWLREGSLMRTSKAEPEAVIGTELANRLGTKLGETLQLIPAGANSSSAIIPIRRVRVVGFFRSGLFEYDSTWVYLSFETAAAFAGSVHAASIVSVQISNPEDVKRIAARVKQTLGNSYHTIDWQDANQPLFAALALERRMGLFIIGLIIVIAVLNITTMLILVVVERRRDIAVLSTLGAKRVGVMLVFIIEGAVVGAVGALIGVLIGLVTCAVVNQFKLVSLPADVYSISNVPLHAGWIETALAALFAFLLSVAATIYPARAAAKMRPVETLRDAG